MDDKKIDEVKEQLMPEIDIENITSTFLKMDAVLAADIHEHKYTFLEIDMILDMMVMKIRRAQVHASVQESLSDAIMLSAEAQQTLEDQMKKVTKKEAMYT